MVLLSYNNLAPKLAEKNMGRKHEANINKGPDLWARLQAGTVGNDIVVTFHGNRVATLRPDNSLTITINGWHTQSSCKIITALAGMSGAALYNNRIWFQAEPMLSNTLEFNSNCQYISQRECSEVRQTAAEQLLKVNIDCLPPRERFMYELGQYRPQPAVTKNVIAYALGRTTIDKLTPRDIFTCINAQVRILTRCLETLV
jgi:hypothetical protein